VQKFISNFGTNAKIFPLGIAGPGNTKGGKYHCTIDLLFDWFGISCMTTDNFCFYLQNRLFQTSQTGGQRYSDTSPFSIPWLGSQIFRLEKCNMDLSAASFCL
jgi:hypothetical protein